MSGVQSSSRAASAAVWFLAAVTLYFAAQLALRLILGGALETDEAEMMVMTPGLRLGYGPQLPLYNWLQVLLFEVFGRSLFALAFLKNLLLWGTYVLLFLGFRLWVPAGHAALAALSVYLVPDIAWEAQRATTHSNMLLLTLAATLAAFLWVLKSGRVAAWLALGLALAAGGLAKYNYWLLPLGLGLAALSLPALRPRLLTPRALIAPGLAAVLLILPYRWMLTHPALAFSSTGKLAMEEGGGGPSLAGLGPLAEGFAALAGLPLLVAGGLALGFRARGVVGAPGHLRPLLTRAALIMMAAIAAGVVAAGVGHITPRWLLPPFVTVVPALYLALTPRLRPRGGVAFGGVLAVLAVLVLAGLAYDRYKPGARRDVDFSALPARLEAVADMAKTPVVAEFYSAGNLARLRPGWRIAPYLAHAAKAFGGETVLFLIREDVPGTLAAGIAQAGWPPGTEGTVLAEGAFDLGFAHSDRTMPFTFALIRMPAP